jgi:uncharacterized protein
MRVRRVVASDAVEEDAGKVALERGPIVYCAEGADNGGRALNLKVPDRAPLTAEFRPDLLKGVVVIKGQDLLAIPYYAWANRGVGEMAVWLARK